jgi:hypothetical protein
LSIAACVAFNYDKIHQNCTLLEDFFSTNENPSIVSGPKACGNLIGMQILFTIFVLFNLKNTNLILELQKEKSKE